MFAALLRTLLYPFRWCATRLQRRSFLRSLGVFVVKKAARRRWLLASLTQIRPLDRPDITFAPADSMVLETVYWLGVQGYEGALAELWPRLCSRAKSVLEVGGNVGFYAVLGGKTAPHYTVVEPVPDLARRLRENLRRNSLDRVEVVEAAIIPGSIALRVGMNLPDEGREAPVGAHLESGIAIAARSFAARIEVAGLPMAELAKGRDLIKIDAEGAEHALIHSILPQIERDRPTLVVEVLPEAEALATLLADLAQRLAYTIHVIPAYRSDGPVAVPATDFTARTPGMFLSKDVILCRQPL